jgi:type I restriction-modification system DNA methylase subunit
MTSDSGSDLSYADTLWKSADALRGQVDAAEGKLGGEFYTPRSVVHVLVEEVANGGRSEGACRG